MHKAYFAGFALFALALSACGGSGSVAPSPTGTPVSVNGGGGSEKLPTVNGITPTLIVAGAGSLVQVSASVTASAPSGFPSLSAFGIASPNIYIALAPVAKTSFPVDAIIKIPQSDVGTNNVLYVGIVPNTGSATRTPALETVYPIDGEFDIQVVQANSVTGVTLAIQAATASGATPAPGCTSVTSYGQVCLSTPTSTATTLTVPFTLTLLSSVNPAVQQTAPLGCGFYSDLGGATINPDPPTGTPSGSNTVFSAAATFTVLNGGVNCDVFLPVEMNGQNAVVGVGGQFNVVIVTPTPSPTPGNLTVSPRTATITSGGGQVTATISDPHSTAIITPLSTSSCLTDNDVTISTSNDTAPSATFLITATSDGIDIGGNPCTLTFSDGTNQGYMQITISP